MAETSRLWAEFRLAVVGHLVVGDLDRGQLGVELKSLSAKKWKHPITGTRVTFGYSTIERWYYIVLNNPKARLRALSKRRCDAGLPSSLTNQARRYLASQAKRHPSWSYHRHHQTLVRHMKERELGRTPGYSTVQRYLRPIFSSQNVSAVGATIFLRAKPTRAFMNNQEPDLNQTPAETDSAKTNESVQRERSELPVDQRSSYLRSRQIALKKFSPQVGDLS